MLVRFVQILLFLVVAYHPSVGLRYLAYKPPQAEEQSRLIEEAAKNKFTVGQVEFIGNETIRHSILARRILFNEGDIFARELLEQSVRNLSKLKLIKPVTVKDVEVRLDRDEKLIDFLFKVTERQRSPKAQKPKRAS
ncbi:MAG TPA: POTRA domain-containing protein [Pyrinomonadaceae bacterium]|nr:POTRA domain-containing protein [Pyrinomonadaceae bacterium]